MESRTQGVTMKDGGQSIADVWQCRHRTLSLQKPLAMGILNITPDSFSDGGLHYGLEQALARGCQMLAEGAVIIDIGGESTRPGFTPIDANEELRRILPVIRGLRAKVPTCAISVDTMKAHVAAAAIEAGADIINDVSGAADPDLLRVARDTGAGLVLMQGYDVHVGKSRQATPGQLGDWAAEELAQLMGKALKCGIPAKNLVVDPGFGFGKRHVENAEVLRALPTIAARCGRPVLVAASRKHFLVDLFPECVNDPLAANLRFVREAVRLGGKIFRVHDVIATCEVLTIPLE